MPLPIGLAVLGASAYFAWVKRQGAQPSGGPNDPNAARVYWDSPDGRLILPGPSLYISGGGGGRDSIFVGRAGGGFQAPTSFPISPGGDAEGGSGATATGTPGVAGVSASGISGAPGASIGGASPPGPTGAGGYSVVGETSGPQGGVNLGAIGNAALGVIGGLVGIAASILSGNPIGAVMGAINTGKAIAGAIQGPSFTTPGVGLGARGLTGNISLADSLRSPVVTNRQDINEDTEATEAAAAVASGQAAVSAAVGAVTGTVGIGSASEGQFSDPTSDAGVSGGGVSGPTGPGSDSGGTPGGGDNSAGTGDGGGGAPAGDGGGTSGDAE